jgi:hypothetical protein
MLSDQKSQKEFKRKLIYRSHQNDQILPQISIRKYLFNQNVIKKNYRIS